MSTEPNSYDEVPYAARPRYATHPDSLATLARLLGMKPVPVERCRVLELGCATGGNLIPIAELCPESQFVGIDLSARQIAMGQKVVEEIGLANLRLEARSILEVDPSFGTFDYIICHGVYSWVPQEVRDRILSICQNNLSPQGVAYVSYNTYPGWYLRAGTRDLMRFATRGVADPPSRIQFARAFLEFVMRNNPEPEGTWARVLKEEADVVLPEKDYYLFHEHLESENQAFYFQEFMAHARRFGLQYLGEASMHTSLSVYPQEVQDTLRRISTDLLDLEQYLDFLKNRAFRHTLLVHDAVALDRAPGPDIAQQFLITGLARPRSADPDLYTHQTEEFANEKGSTISTNIPANKAALVVLYETWPRVFQFDELWEEVRRRIGSDAVLEPLEKHRAILARSLVQLYLSGLVGLHTYLAPLTLTPSELPRATAVVRSQARSGLPITNGRHKHVDPPVFDRAVLSLCDGARDRAALVEGLLELVQTEQVGLTRDGKLLTEEAAIRETLHLELEGSLERLARSLVLVA